jgi:hypothetical protein
MNRGSDAGTVLAPSLERRCHAHTTDGCPWSTQVPFLPSGPDLLSCSGRSLSGRTGGLRAGRQSTPGRLSSAAVPVRARIVGAARCPGLGLGHGRGPRAGGGGMGTRTRGRGPVVASLDLSSRHPRLSARRLGGGVDASGGGPPPSSPPRKASATGTHAVPRRGWRTERRGLARDRRPGHRPGALRCLLSRTRCRPGARPRVRRRWRGDREWLDPPPGSSDPTGR